MFKGAGILFYKKSTEGSFISLGKRTGNIDTGSWSIPGGEMDKKENNDFFQCALRETISFVVMNPYGKVHIHQR